MDTLPRTKKIVMEHHHIIIIGAGQGGLGVSYYLSIAGINHLILEQGGIANSWKEKRWDSFCLVTPNWTINLPGKPYSGPDPNGFMKRDEFVSYFKKWADDFNAPVRGGVKVNKIITQNNGFLLKTNKGEISSDIVIVATATYQLPKLPEISQKIPKEVTQIHAENYKNPTQIGDGAVLVVGSGQTGSQIVDDLLKRKKNVHLCVGRSGRLPRNYRGRDCISWQKDLNLLDRTPDMLDSPAFRFRGDPHLSGRDGGKTLSLHKFNREGVRLYGRLIDFRNNEFIFGDNLLEDIRFSDDFAKDFRRIIDNYIRENEISVREADESDTDGDFLISDPAFKNLREMNFQTENLRTVIWATGFMYDFSWIDGDITDEMGYPVTKMGATSIKGLYFNGLNWMTKRKSGILYGFDEDSRNVSDQVIAFSKKGKIGAFVKNVVGEKCM